MPRIKHKTDEHVLDELLPFLLDAGLDRVTLKQMSGVVGLSTATLLQRFGSRTALIEAALDRATEHLARTVDEPLPTGDSPETALVAWLAALARPIADRRRLVGSFPVLRRDILDDARNQSAKRHLALVRGRIRTGLIAMGFNDEAAAGHARLVEAHWHGLVLQWALSGTGTLDTWISDGVHELLTHLRPRP